MEIKDRRTPIVEGQKEAKIEIEKAERQLANLDSASGQQEIKLKNASRDTAEAYEWLLKNQNKFEQEVFGPPIVTCSITDPKFADAVESIFQKTDFTSFTVQNRNDFRTMQRELLGGMQLHDISIRTCSMSLDQLKPPMPNDQIRQLGFDGWARDFLTGPDTVIAMLCSEKNLHATPISVGEISEAAFSRLQESSSLSSWVSGKSAYNITRRREYGPGATSTRVRQVKSATIWTSQPVDQSLKHRYQEDIDLWKEKLADLTRKFDSEKDTVQKLREESEQLNKDMVLSFCFSVFHPLTDSFRRKRLRRRKRPNRLRTLNTGQFQN